MHHTRLRAILRGGSSITFDGRPRADTVGLQHVAEGFFESRLLRNVILAKLAVTSDAASDQGDLQTLIYFPYDAQALGKGGRSVVFMNGAEFRTELQRNFGIDKSDKKFDADVARLEVFNRAPSFSAFLLRDAFERTGLPANQAFFDISDQEADAARDRLKTKLKPLAAMALDRSLDAVGGGQLELLVRKLWQLDDPNYLHPLTRALQIADTDAVDTLYAWIGVSYLQGEFVRREARVRALAEWLAKKSTPVENLSSLDIRDYQADRQFVREKLRIAWTAAAKIFEELDKSYRSLISSGGDPKPFVDFMRNVRSDFRALGVSASMIDQCLSVFDLWMEKIGLDRVTFDTLRQIVGSMLAIWTDGDQASGDTERVPVSAAQIAAAGSANAFAPKAIRTR